MIIRTEITIEGKLPGKRATAKYLKQSWQRRGDTWKGKMMPRHFSNLAFGLYGYRPRKRGYNAVKRRRTGRVLPLVFSGDSRARSRGAVVRARKNQVVVRVPVPTLNKRSKTSNINMRAEMQAIATSEAKLLDKQQGEFVEKRFNQHRGRRRTS